MLKEIKQFFCKHEYELARFETALVKTKKQNVLKLVAPHGSICCRLCGKYKTFKIEDSNCRFYPVTSTEGLSVNYGMFAMFKE